MKGKTKTNKLAVVILAAGEGTRMKSKKTKVLHQLLGRPMITYPVGTALALDPEKIIVVVGVQAEDVKNALSGQGVLFAFQKERKGTGHAVMAAMPLLENFSGEVLVLYGDSALLKPGTLKKLVRLHRRKNADMTLLIVDNPNPTGYGRILRNQQGEIVGIVEEKDCSPGQKKITEVNPGIYCFRTSFLKQALPRLKNHNKQREYYLTDLVAIAVQQNAKLASMKCEDPKELLGVNTRAELALVSQALRTRINEDHCKNGVTIEDPENTWIGPEVKIGKDTVIEPFARITGRTVIEPECHIEMTARIEDSIIKRGARIKQGSVIEQSEVKERAQVGPMAHLRPGSVIGRDARIGNFVETKKARIGDGTKSAHLTYIGDAEVGKNVNIGCGFITCNYDGEKKWKTVIEDRVFVGSDSQAVAPVRVGKGAYIGSGTTITEDIPSHSLALTRAPLVIKPGWAKKKKKKSKNRS